jgi:hypothetical protein
LFNPAEGNAANMCFYKHLCCHRGCEINLGDTRSIFHLREKGKRPLYLGKEGDKRTNTLLSCQETRKWNAELLSKKLLDINGEVDYEKILS